MAELIPDWLQAALDIYNNKMKTNFVNLKKEQIEVIIALMTDDVLCVLPTGFGKSLIFGLLPYCCQPPATVILMSPLNSIIDEQHERLGQYSGG